MNDADDQPAAAKASPALNRVFADHTRHWRDFAYVYPVISRRSQGLSIGINLNPDTACNFDCIYCCVNRTQPPRVRKVELAQLRHELNAMLTLATSGELWRHEPFRDVPREYQRINDLAFSGDGEPTTCPVFEQAVDLAVQCKREHGLADAKLILITNATMLDREPVQRALRVLDANGGQVWAKLDAGTEAYYQKVDRARVPMRQVLDNILLCGKQRPLVIQSLFMQIDGQPVPDDEFDAYLDQLAQLMQQGCRIQSIQLYTVARRTAEHNVTALSHDQLDQLAQRTRHRLNNVQVAVYYGV